MKGTIFKKWNKTIVSFLKTGMVPEKISLTLALGICFGIMPLMGINTILLGLLAILLRLNLPAIQLVNYSVYFIQLFIYLPLLGVSQKIFIPDQQINLSSILETNQGNFLKILEDLWHVHLGAIILWASFSIPLGIFIYRKSLVVISRKN